MTLVTESKYLQQHGTDRHRLCMWLKNRITRCTGKLVYMVAFAPYLVCRSYIGCSMATAMCLSENNGRNGIPCRRRVAVVIVQGQLNRPNGRSEACLVQRAVRADWHIKPRALDKRRGRLQLDVRDALEVLVHCILGWSPTDELVHPLVFLLASFAAVIPILARSILGLFTIVFKENEVSCSRESTRLS
jgi:hypothetical protein